MTRQQRTPKERAEIALGVAERKLERARSEYDRLAAEYDAAGTTLAEATRLHDYAKQHPALQTPGTTPTTQEEGTPA